MLGFVIFLCLFMLPDQVSKNKTGCSKKLQFISWVLRFIMSHTNDLIFSELRESGITPKNELYEQFVQDWLLFYLGDLGIWNSNPQCHCHDSWVEATAFSFQKYAKKIWTGSYVNVRSKNKVWFEKSIEFPVPIECACMDHTMDESGIVDDVNVNEVGT